MLWTSWPHKMCIFNHTADVEVGRDEITTAFYREGQAQQAHVLPGRRPATPVLHVGEGHALLGLHEVPGLRAQTAGQRLPNVEDGAGLSQLSQRKHLVRDAPQSARAFSYSFKVFFMVLRLAPDLLISGAASSSSVTPRAIDFRSSAAAFTAKSAASANQLQDLC